MPAKDLALWLSLFHVPGLGAARWLRLMSRWPTPEQLLGASASALKQAGMEDELIQTLLACDAPHSPSMQLAQRDMDWSDGLDRHIMTLADDDYPALLHQIRSPPPVLFIRGRRDALNHPQLAIVGSRNTSPYGRESAFGLAAALTAKGLGICSGFARGVDTQAHQAAIQTQGITVAVLGSGVDTIYPAENQRLIPAVCERGAIVSEFPRSVAPKPTYFPRRNRVISGLSLGVLVVEATLRSGSLITARLALEQDREVFAVPGSIRSAQSRGCHRLLREGATLVETADDIIQQLSSLLAFQLQPLVVGKLVDGGKNRDAVTHLSGEQGELFREIGDEPVAVNALISRTGKPLAQITEMLLELELQGLVSAIAGGYVRS